MPHQAAGLPVVPMREPRPAQGNQPNEKWNTIPAGGDRAPVASFIDTLRGNDAALEVLVGQGRLLTIKSDLPAANRPGFIAVGDPAVLDFEVLPDPRMIRLIGKRAGVTDLSITAANGQTYSLEVRVVYDLDLLRAHLRQVFPDALIRVAQMREYLVLEGQARSTAQVSDIQKDVEAYVGSALFANQGASMGTAIERVPMPPPAPSNGARDETTETTPLPKATIRNVVVPGQSSGYGQPVGRQPVGPVKPRVINLIRVPGVQQVLLQVRVAELNRTCLREIGADLGIIAKNQALMGTNLASATVNAASVLGLGGITGGAAVANGAKTTAFGIFPNTNFEVMLRALCENSLVSILAEPNLIALDGHRASFLAGGQFPVPVPQGGSGAINSVTVEFKDFGVQLDFVPHVLENDAIRLQVTPEVSTIDFALGTVLVTGGSPVPGLNTRRASTTVELREGQTLAIAGLLQVEIDAKSGRIPGLGDLPVLGPMFSNTSHKKVEKELLVLVTPHLIAPMNKCQVPPLPGSDLKEPGDLEFYLLNRIEGKSGCRSATSNEPNNYMRLMRLEQRNVSGPVGFSQ